MKHNLATLALAALPLHALADEAGSQSLFYAAAGGGFATFCVGGGTKTDVLELNSINLGTVSGKGSARFLGISLVQNATPINGFNFMFRIGLGRQTTNFPDVAATARRTWFNQGIFFGLGEQYQVNKHLAFRAEVNRIVYAASPDATASGVRYPVTLSAMFIF
jgi:glutamine amidotransferase-like uncharacterized protein